MSYIENKISVLHGLQLLIKKNDTILPTLVVVLKAREVLSNNPCLCNKGVFNSI